MIKWLMNFLGYTPIINSKATRKPVAKRKFHGPKLGRHLRKLSVLDVVGIRRMYNNGVSIPAIAKTYKCTPSNIRLIAKYETFKWVK